MLLMSSFFLLKIANWCSTIFLIYSAFFWGDNAPEGFVKITLAIIAFIALGLFVSVFRIPFIHIFSPVLFEWYWHDIDFWEFTDLANLVVIINIVCTIIFIAAGVRSDHQNRL